MTLTASLIGPATSPGLSLCSRPQHAESSSSKGRIHRILHPSPSDNLESGYAASTGPHFLASGSLSRHATSQDRGEEEIVWTDRRVVWSRGGELFRQWTFAELSSEDTIRWAGFAWFPYQVTEPETSRALSSSNGSDYAGTNRKTKEATFGPFHSAQYASWGTPDPSGHTTTTILVRTLTVLFNSHGLVYYPSGEVHSFHVPFIIASGFPISKSEGGGIIFERELEKRELQKHGSVLSGLDSIGGVGMMSVLDQVMDLGPDEELPKIYTLLNPFYEFKMVVEGKVRNDRILGSEQPIESDLTTLHITEAPYPLVVVYDTSNSDIIFYRRVEVPPGPPTPPTPAPNIRTMRPEDILKQGTPSTFKTPTVPGGSRIRPSMQRTASGYSTTGERRVSNIPDPMDRSRRGPRMSKGGQSMGIDAGLSGMPTTSKGELQATLDPPPMPSSSTTTTNMPGGLTVRTRNKGKTPARDAAAARESMDSVRRQSAASSFMREDPDAGKAIAGVHGLVDKDLRETTMMMGLEREEESARSEIVLERLYTWRPPEEIDSDSVKVFISDNLSSNIASINFFTGSTLHVFQARNEPQTMSRWQIHPVRSVPCDSAIPIISTRHDILDTLILQHGQLSISTSFGRSIPLNLPKIGVDRDELPSKLASSLSMRLDADESMTSNATPRPVELADPVNGQFTVIYEDGEKLRLSADLRVADELVRQCLESIAWIIDEETTFYIKCIVLEALQDLPTSQKADTEAAWKRFHGAIAEVLGLSQDSQMTTEESMICSAHTSADPVTRRLASRLGKRRTPPAPSSTLAESRLPAQDGESILLALHLVAQDCRLSSSRQIAMERIGSLILPLVAKLGRPDWWDYWMRLISVSNGKPPNRQPIASALLNSFETPPDILLYLSRRLTTPLKPFPSPQSCAVLPISENGHTTPCTNTARVIAIYDRLGPSTSNFDAEADHVVSRGAATVRYLVENGITHEWIADLPFGVGIPILEMIRVCQISPALSWSAEMYNFVSRPDLAAQLIDYPWKPDGHAPDTGDEEIPTIGDIVKTVSGGLQNKTYTPAMPHVRFGSDRRVQEVERILQTTRVRTISVQEPKNASDQEVVQYQQSMVNTIANRTLAIPVGQGIFAYGTRSTTLTDAWDIPLIELSVKIHPGNTLLQAQLSAENADWPCFHNGVAAALSISPDCKGIDSSWILHNRPHTLNPEHGGFLLGLGLTGHLRSLLAYHAFPYLEPRHDFTSVGLLLGLAASHAGSEDLLITKVLSLHTHALLPLGSMELNASAIIQSTALLGLGLVYTGSKNVRMAEVALGEVGRRDMPGVDGFQEYQEAYSFSASMAFGLIMLGRGGQVTSEVDRRMLLRLHRCITGGAANVDGSMLAIDTTMTAPSATLALGLMYLKTGRRDVADTLEIPQSAFRLESVRPDVLLLRTFARALIMWDDINPSLAWIESQLPSFIHHHGHKHTTQMESNTELAYFYIVAGACLAIGLKYAGTATELAHTNLMFFFSVLSKASAGQSMTYEGKIRRLAARQGLNVIAIALSVVMSGTGELSVLRRLRLSHGQEGAGVTYGTHMAMHMACGILFLGRGHYTLGNSNYAIAAMAISFFPRFMSSPGDNKAYPQAFRHLWAVAVEPRCLIARDVDTRETIYLPVKVKLREGDQVRQQNLISPTLIAPLGSIISISVDSPRYWPITYDLDNLSSRAALVKTRTIYVKRKAGFLDYNSDPKGNRSIFVRAGSMTGFDLHYDLISASSPPSITAEEVSVLVQAHSGDPALIEMAKHFSGDTQLDKFVRTILLECISLDKPRIISVYMAMISALTEHQRTTETITQLAFTKVFYLFFDKYYVVSNSVERRFALIRPNFVAALDRIVSETRADTRGYFTDGTWDGGLELAKKVLVDRLPDEMLLDQLRGRVRSSGADNGDEVLLKVRYAAEVYMDRLIRQWDAVESGDTNRPGWSYESAKEAITVWLEGS